MIIRGSWMLTGGVYKEAFGYRFVGSARALARLAYRMLCFGQMLDCIARRLLW